MLKGISPLLSPAMLATLCEMGHGDRIVLADAHFPGHSLNKKVIRAEGIKINDLLRSILPLFELDSYVENPVVMMEPVSGDTSDPAVKRGYQAVILELAPGFAPIIEVNRFSFYDAARSAYALILTGDTAKYGNIMLTKGVTPV